jgi:hypothetical protein
MGKFIMSFFVLFATAALAQKQFQEFKREAEGRF